jgi:hypothetical protein
MLLVEDAVLFEPVSSIKFPVHRQKNRDFPSNRPQVASFDQECHGRFSHLCSKSLVARTGDSDDKWEYEAKIAKRFGFEQQPKLPIPLPRVEQQEAAN